MRRKLFLSTDMVFFCCAFATVAFAPLSGQKLELEKQTEKEAGEARKEWFQADLSDLIDYLLPLLSRVIVENEMDPLTIPDVGRSFWIMGPLLFLPAIQAEFTYSFSSGSLYYLSTLERYGNVIVAYGDKTLSIDANLMFDRILLSCDYFLKLLFLRQHGKIIAAVSSIRVSIEIDFNILTCELTLKAFELNSVESINIFTNQNTLLERWIMPLTNFITFLIKNTLTEEIEERTAASLQGYLDQVNEKICLWSILQLFTTTWLDPKGFD